MSEELILTIDGWKPASEVDPEMFITTGRCLNCGDEYKCSAGGCAGHVQICYKCKQTRKKGRVKRGGQGE